MHATLACSNATPAGVCVVTACVGTPWRDCNGVGEDGCEQDVQNDIAHCGACTTACTGQNAIWACRAGACAVQNCNAGFDDCNGVPTDGCEVNLMTDSANCGQCRMTCLPVLGIPLACVNAVCSLL